MVEQEAIVTYIERFNVKISAAVFMKEGEIDKLKEYKASLINSSVTGKIKVF
jgi:type I restriction enzyme S subunit